MFNYLMGKAKAMALGALEIAVTPILLPIFILFEAENVFNSAQERKIAQRKKTVTQYLGVVNYFVNLHLDFSKRSVDLSHPMSFAPFARNPTEETIMLIKGCCRFCHQKFAKSKEQLEIITGRYRAYIQTALLQIMAGKDFKLLETEYDDITFSFNKSLNRIELSQCGTQLNEELIIGLNLKGVQQIESYTYGLVKTKMLDKCPVCAEKMFKIVYDSMNRLVLKKYKKDFLE